MAWIFKSRWNRCPLDIAEQGEDLEGASPLDKVVSKEKNYSIYDFKKPNRITSRTTKSIFNYAW